MKKKTWIWIIAIAVVVLIGIIIVIVAVENNRENKKYDALIVTADTYMDNNEYAQAAVVYREAADLLPGRAEAWFGLSEAFMSNDKPEQAVEILYEAIKEVRDEAQVELLTQEKDRIEDTLRFRQDEGEDELENDQDSINESGDVPDDDTEEKADTENDTPDEEPEDENIPDSEEQPEDEQPKDNEIDGTIDTEMLNNAISMKHSQLLETYGASTSEYTDLGWMVKYQRCPAYFFYGYGGDGKTDTDGQPYDYTFPNAVSFRSPDEFISDVDVLTLEEVSALFDAQASVEYNEMDGEYNVLVPYKGVTLTFTSDENGSVEITDGKIMFIYDLA